MDYCNVYVNEHSAVCRLIDAREAEEAVKALLDCLEVLDNCDAGAVVVKKYYSSVLYTSPLLDGGTVQTLRNKDLKRRFKLSLRGACCWDGVPLTDVNAAYLHKGNDVSMTSMSESYEQVSPLLVNFLMSNIGEPIAVIEKSGISTKEVVSYSDTASLLAFVIAKGWRRNHYDLTSSLPPHDEESILSDASRFEATAYSYNGRTMYRRKGTDHLCYIDSKHFGEAAHIEEFNENTLRMIGTVRINEDVEHHPMTRNEKRRKLRIG